MHMRIIYVKDYMDGTTRNPQNGYDVVYDVTMTTPLQTHLAGWMADQNLTQAEAGALLNVSQSTIARWLNGSTPGTRTLQQIADTIGVPFATLLDTTGPVTGIGMLVTAAETAQAMIAGLSRDLSGLDVETLDATSRGHARLAAATFQQSATALAESVGDLLYRLDQIAD